MSPFGTSWVEDSAFVVACSTLEQLTTAVAEREWLMHELAQLSVNEVAPTNGKACKEGWMNIGAGYCKKKKGPLGIL